MSFSENWHAALDLQVGGSNKKQKTKKTETRTNNTGKQQKQSGNNKTKEVINNRS